jgi:alpha,alpha-trehalase
MQIVRLESQPFHPTQQLLGTVLKSKNDCCADTTYFDGGVFSGIQTNSKSGYGTTQLWIYVDNPLRAACAALRSLPARLLRGVSQPGSGSLLALVVILPSGGISAGSASAQIPSCASEVPPSEQLGELFQQVQLKHIFPDSKTFADLVADEAPNAILAEYQARKDEAGFDLSSFVNRHFSMPAEGPNVRPALPGERLETYVARLWDVLRHQSGEPADRSSLLPLPYPYIVPGGRFRELYYWDSFFIMLGLEADGRHDLALDMLKDFAFQIDCYGHVPNGNRTYYLSRSQPPFFSLMVDLIAQREGDGSYAAYLPELESEYAYWMDGSAFLPRGQAYRRLVRLADGTLLNRYWDDRAVPRDESYREDVETALGHKRDPGDLYRNLRAAAESGWDFSSRWLADGHSLNTIRTVSLLPIDLNSLMAIWSKPLPRRIRSRATLVAHPGSQSWRLTARRRFGA